MKNRILYLFLIMWGAGLLLLFNYQPGEAQQIPPTPTSTGMKAPMDLMVPPPLPKTPDQADYGAQDYYYVCMACHGDRGQGLTPQWMEEWNLGKNPCWQSKCHAANHPPEGFKLPRTIPGVIGQVFTNEFYNGLDLHDFLKKEMPWHNPGYLRDDQYWNLTAFLLRENGYWKNSTVINESTAASYFIRLKIPSETLDVMVTSIAPMPVRTPISVKPANSADVSSQVIWVAPLIGLVILIAGLYLNTREQT